MVDPRSFTLTLTDTEFEDKAKKIAKHLYAAWAGPRAKDFRTLPHEEKESWYRTARTAIILMMDPTVSVPSDGFTTKNGVPPAAEKH